MRNLDTFSINIIPEDIPGGMGNKIKENTFLRISCELSPLLGWRSNPDMASKSSEPSKVISLTSGHFERRGILTLRSKGIGDPEMMIKGIRPKLDIQISTGKENSDYITNILVGSFDGTILMRYISSCRVNGIAVALEKILNLGVSKQFPSLI